eukprot:TRINITY_DN121835_c0_g1_i1.p1 TRINITY_DN121835_c0_g1~~TRINITY_DN121835_c0_g1_i1.p1  ORF type:complete len:223 (-),score=36.93 TRINITY_DN121835_c0_g1_i1:284-952(-)
MPPPGMVDLGMATFVAEIQREGRQTMGFDAHVVNSDSRQLHCILVNSITEGGLLDQWNRNQTEDYKVIRKGDFIVKVNDVVAMQAGGNAMGAELSRGGDVKLHVMGMRAMPETNAPTQQETPNTLLRERLEQLENCTRICTRTEWLSTWAPRLRLSDAAELAADCCICMQAMQDDARIRGLACGHVFHLECIGAWFMQDRSMQLTCPNCRTPISQQQRIVSL